MESGKPNKRISENRKYKRQRKTTTTFQKYSFIDECCRTLTTLLDCLFIHFDMHCSWI